MFWVLLIVVSLSFGVSIEEAVRTAIKNNPEIKALEEEMKVFKGKAKSATAFPNPELRFESGFITNDEDGKPKGKALYLFEFNQPIPMWGIREKARSVVKKEEESFKYFTDAYKRRIIAQVYRSFYNSLFLKE
ncbi:TolC family protein [Aquifex aeolicus]|uniref:TolC family protein n=1 Tax=Aquifex aeolicus TaxID=63363 RepID=UPI0002DE9B56|nr:TolC family protein [Aquifex aeolicus]